jgi:hypothetical protein
LDSIHLRNAIKYFEKSFDISFDSSLPRFLFVESYAACLKKTDEERAIAFLKGLVSSHPDVSELKRMFFDLGMETSQEPDLLVNLAKDLNHLDPGNDVYFQFLQKYCKHYSS